jgi:RNA polymerase sigma factor (sigma-70 family)
VDRGDEELFVTNATELTRFATGIVGPFEAQDVVSSAFLRCVQVRQWPSIEDKRAYLFRAVLNEARAVRRSAGRRRRREDGYGARALASAAPPRDAPRPEVLDAVRRLSLRQRAVIVLTYWEDWEPSRVATHLGISEGAVRRHLARARARLRREIDARL